VPPGEIASIIESLAKLPEPPASVRRLQLWCHPAVAMALVGLLGLFWVMRKRQGLV
jgi:cytochrome c-type biogenesis protein CcmH/NrfF